MPEPEREASVLVPRGFASVEDQAAVQAKRANSASALEGRRESDLLDAYLRQREIEQSAKPVCFFGSSQVVRREESELLQRYPKQDGTKRKDALIYAITTNDPTTILYVGQTTDARAGDRFIEHVKTDSWAPWWLYKPNTYGDDETKWPYRVHGLENLKNVTKFETTVAEQWWLEYQLKQGHKLLNDSTPCSLENFKKRSINPSLYDPKNIGVATSWKPSMKAK